MSYRLAETDLRLDHLAQPQLPQLSLPEMNVIKGDKLYVELSASQTRRRLKGLGFGVRKVESAGKNRAVIIHTATGDHRRELLAIFQDVLSERDSEEA